MSIDEVLEKLYDRMRVSVIQDKSCPECRQELPNMIPAFTEEDILCVRAIIEKVKYNLFIREK